MTGAIPVLLIWGAWTIEGGGVIGVRIQLNGELHQIPEACNIRQLLEHLELPTERIAVERNRSVVPRSQWDAVALAAEDEIEVVHFVGGGAGAAPDEGLVIAGRRFSSRLIVGTGKYKTMEIMVDAHQRSGAEMVTVAVRRVDLKAPKGKSFFDHIDTSRFMILPNTAGCYNTEDAVRTAHLGREAGLSEWVKLEVIGDEQTLFPDTAALIEATAILAKDGFDVAN